MMQDISTVRLGDHVRLSEDAMDSFQSLVTLERTVKRKED
jgi:hypothetical protein